MPALLISGTNMRAGRGDSREDCSALFSVFTAEQEMRATCSMPCKQLLPGECTSSAANRQVNASAGADRCPDAGCGDHRTASRFTAPPRCGLWSARDGPEFLVCCLDGQPARHLYQQFPSCIACAWHWHPTLFCLCDAGRHGCGIRGQVRFGSRNARHGAQYRDSTGCGHARPGLS